jgi:hypothetical protein
MSAAAEPLRRYERKQGSSSVVAGRVATCRAGTLSYNRWDTASLAGLIECGVSFYGAISANSLALLAFGADSFVELLSATVVLLAIVTSFPLAKDRAAWLAGILLLSLQE